MTTGSHGGGAGGRSAADVQRMLIAACSPVAIAMVAVIPLARHHSQVVQVTTVLLLALLVAAAGTVGLLERRRRRAATRARGRAQDRTQAGLDSLYNSYVQRTAVGVAAFTVSLLITAAAACASSWTVLDFALPTLLAAVLLWVAYCSFAYLREMRQG